MIHGRNRLLKAARVLLCDERPMRERLIDATQMLQASLAVADQWDPAVRERAFAVIRECHRTGSLRSTAEALDDDSVVHLANEILSVIEQLEGIPNIAELDCDDIG